MDTLLKDQFAFRPSGSTTAAIVSLLYHITDLLVTNSHVTITSLDFSKAFDTIRHSALVIELARVDIPDSIFNWIINYLQDRGHMTRFAGRLSSLAYINASIVQGSGIGPTTSVLQDHENRMVKFANDTYLLVGSTKWHTISTELDHITEWAKQNNLRLNAAKTSAMIIRKRRKELPPPLSGIKRVKSMVILGITITDDLRASNHVDSVIASCSQSMYALRVLKAHGLPAAALHTVTRATTIARLLYASPAWWGLITEKDRARLDKLYMRIKRMDYQFLTMRPLFHLWSANRMKGSSVQLNSIRRTFFVICSHQRPNHDTNSGPGHMIMFSLSRMLKTLSRATYTSSR